MAEHIKTDNKCFKCGQPLTLEEMHYYERENGKATCEQCEEKWADAIAAWRKGETDDYPEH